MIDVCLFHGKVNSRSWRYTSRGSLCGKCFKVKFQPLGFVTGTSQRVQMDREKAEKELTQPWMGGKPNPEFIKTHPQHAPHYFHQHELDKMDAEKMKSRREERFKGENEREEAQTDKALR